MSMHGHDKELLLGHMEVCVWKSFHEHILYKMCYE